MSITNTLEEQLEIYVEQIKLLLDSDAFESIKQYNETLHSADIAEILMELDDDNRNKYFGMLEHEQAGGVLEDLSPEIFSELLRPLTDEAKPLILDCMSQDDIVDKLGELPEKRRKEIIAYLDIEYAKDVSELLVYDEDTAGGIMTMDIVALKKDMMCGEAITVLRETAPDTETIYYVFVTDYHDRLVGVISLRELIMASPGAKIGEIMNEHTISVNVNEDQEEVAKVVSKYDFLAVPVIDDIGVLKGIITVDDVIDVIEEEATEDMLKFAGTSDLEMFEDESSFTRVIYSVRSRLPWLIVTLFGGFLSASVMNKFQDTIKAYAVLMLFVPLLAGMGGNVGTQSSTITVRNLALENIQGKDVFKTILMESSIGLMVGFVCSILVATAAYLSQGDIILSSIVGIAMLVNTFTAATLGTIVPIAFKKFGIDPAVASAPFITTTIDITGLTIYFTLATILIAKFIN
jgi:magnesium transporter